MCEKCRAAQKIAEDEVQTEAFQNMKKIAEAAEILVTACKKHNYPLIYMVKGKGSLIANVGDFEHSLTAIGMVKYLHMLLEGQVYEQQNLARVIPELIETEQKLYEGQAKAGKLN